MKSITQSTNIIGVKELRQNLDKYVRAVARGRSFMVVKRSRPIFAIVAPQALDEFGDPVGYFNETLDLRDESGSGMPIEDFETIVKKVVNDKVSPNERSHPKVSG